MVSERKSVQSSPVFEVRPELAHCDTMRLRTASAGTAVIPALAESWEHTPALRQGVLVTFGLMLWYLHGTVRSLTTEDRVLARRYLLRGAKAEESWVRLGFLEAVDWTHDPTYLPLLRKLAPDSPTIEKLESELDHASAAELMESLAEQWEAMCQEEWISDRGLCRSAKLSFTTVKEAIAAKDARTARAALAALTVNVGAARGRGVTNEVYEILKGVVTAVEGKL